MGHWFKGKTVNDRCGRISDRELIQATDQMMFDNGETEIFVRQKKKASPEKNVNICEHERGQERKKTQALS